MTKYLLFGGYRSKAADKGKAFCQHFVENKSKPIKILVCLFAVPEQNKAENFQKDVDFFQEHLGDSIEKIELASHENFLTQLAQADVLYIGGGKMDLINEGFAEYPNWRQAFKGSVIAGNSAGANLLSTYYYGLRDFDMHEGLGLLPVKIIVHFESNYNPEIKDWKKAHDFVKAFHPELETVTLREGEFKVFTQ